MSQGVQFRLADQRVVAKHAIATLNLAVGSRISIAGRPYEVTALSAIVDSQGSVQLYYVDPLPQKTYYDMSDDFRHDESTALQKAMDTVWAES